MSTPAWYETAVVYQTHVRAFKDANGDGIGDFAGLTEKLGYVRDLGATAIWLLPFYASPLRDGGYDIADYRRIHPEYGDLEDFDRFVSAAHDKGLRVITELVVNHTSDQHPWFQRARRAPAGSPERDWYVWSETGEEYPDVRIIFQDYEPSNWTWDPVAKAYFWHRFFRHQPDLNWDNPAVEQAVHEVVDFWLERGVDGLRLDAIPYLYVREGTTCENLPETHAALKRLRAHVDARFSDRMLLAEANQWPEQAVSFFGEGDECNLNFAFPLMPRLYLSLATEDASSIRDILEQTPELPPGCGWALFLRNHDELTLEMVTHEEREQMWHAYAAEPRAIVNLGLRRRLAPLLGGDQRAIELLSGLLFGLRGTPIVYYGDEIGMGDDIFQPDRDAMRTPMQWSGDRNAGFSSASPQRLYLPVNADPTYRYEAVNVESQLERQGSLLHFTRALLRARRASPALSEGSQTVLPTDDPAVFAALRSSPGQDVLLLANVSARPVTSTVDLAGFDGRRPLDLLTGASSAPIAQGQLTTTLGPRSFLWLQLCAERARPPHIVRSEAGWPDALETPTAETVARRLLTDDVGPTRAIEAQRLDPSGLWLWHVHPRRGPARAAFVREVGEPEAQVILRDADHSVGLLDVSAHPSTVDAVFDVDLGPVAPKLTAEGAVFSAGRLRAVLDSSPEPGPGRHRTVCEAIREVAPAQVPEPVAFAEAAGRVLGRLERLPEGRPAAARTPQDAVSLALGLARLHEAIADSALPSAALTPYDARALQQSLRSRLRAGARRWPRLERALPAALAKLDGVRALPLAGRRLIAHGRPGPSTAWQTPEGIVWLDLAGPEDLPPEARMVPRLPLEDLAALVIAHLEGRALAHPETWSDEAPACAERMLDAYRGVTSPTLLPATEPLHTLWPRLLADAGARLLHADGNPDRSQAREACAVWAVEALARTP